MVCSGFNPFSYATSGLLSSRSLSVTTNEDYGQTTLIKHDVELVPGARPFRCANRPVNPGLEADLKKQILKWLKHHAIEPTQSPCSFRWCQLRRRLGTARRTPCGGAWTSVDLIVLQSQMCSPSATPTTTWLNSASLRFSPPSMRQGPSTR